MLLIGAGLLARSFVLLRQADIGLDPRNVLAADLLLSTRHAGPERSGLFVQALLEAVAAVPGVQHAAVHTDSPYQGGGRRETFTIDGRPDPTAASGHVARCNVVGGDFFRALGIPLVRGRAFDAGDTVNSTPVAVVNETMARQLWPSGAAIGKRLRLYYDTDRQRWLSIVGIVGDARYRYDESARATPFVDAQIFLPHQQRPFRSLPYTPEPTVSLVVRTATEPATLTTAVQAAIWSVDRNQPILNLLPLDRILWQSVAAQRIYTLLLTSFGAIALVIACAGIYGVSAYAVVRRTREIGIRMAVGATSAQVLALVMRHAMVLTLIGVALGIAGALALRQVMSGFLYGITATDVPTFLAVMLLFAAVALISTYVPARRAARIDPAVTFRYE
jgi:putative ABC transport system permease protein